MVPSCSDLVLLVFVGSAVVWCSCHLNLLDANWAFGAVLCALTAAAAAFSEEAARDDGQAQDRTHDVKEQNRQTRNELREAEVDLVKKIIIKVICDVQAIEVIIPFSFVLLRSFTEFQLLSPPMPR